MDSILLKVAYVIMDKEIHVLSIQLHARAPDRFQIVTGTDKSLVCTVRFAANSRPKASLRVTKVWRLGDGYDQFL